MAILRGPDHYASVEDQLAALRPGGRRDSAICRILHETIPTYSWVGIYRQTADEMALAAWSGVGPANLLRLPSSDSRESREENNVRAHAQTGRFLAAARAETQIPFAGTDGAGVLAVASEHRGAFGPADRDLLRLVVALLEDRDR